jgi:hypothetical protein
LHRKLSLPCAENNSFQPACKFAPVSGAADDALYFQ